MNSTKSQERGFSTRPCRLPVPAISAAIIALLLAVAGPWASPASAAQIKRIHPPPPAPVPRPAIPVAPAPVPEPEPAIQGDDCLARLSATGAQFEPATQPVVPEAACIVEMPVRLHKLKSADGLVELSDQPLLACRTAETFASFTAELFAPLARGVYGEKLLSLGTGPGFDCRPRNHAAGAKISAHGKGLAIDIAQFRLAAGPLHSVGEFSDVRDHGFDRAVRAGACGYFHTVLGPGSDPEHARHWHMDLEVRGSDGASKFCK